MLDSSPVSVPRPLKRSASVACLPTPSRTQHKRKRGGSKHSRDSDEDLTATDDDDDDDDAKLIKEAEDEESFWLSTNAPSTTAKNAPAPPLLYRRLLAQSQSQTQLHGVSPASPPPSHRKPPAETAVVPRTPTAKSTGTVSPPSTPLPRCNGAASISRDSPENPFLVSPLSSQDEAISDSVPSSQEEKQTMAFVFRGVRRSLPNPHYNASINPNSQLPPEHPDFEPDERGVRKLLFAVGRKNAEQEPACCWRDGRSDEQEAEEETDMKPKLKPLQFNFTA
ncbi:hypothetical protein B0H14DRAFT_3881199 [Mycena olivaceomarginata]|nr:hypothetical protein B0H14DRAFT_3881199 [Mycena olivaceomarginata]